MTEDPSVDENTRRIRAELEALGYATTVHSCHRGAVIDFDYVVESGQYKGCTFRLGIGTGDTPDGAYPEFPPHWLHLHPPIENVGGGAIEPYDDDRGRKWIALSRPPDGLWDNLPTKGMELYIKEHVRRFWHAL